MGTRILHTAGMNQEGFMCWIRQCHGEIQSLIITPFLADVRPESYNNSVNVAVHADWIGPTVFQAFLNSLLDT
jgi:hypothetical protein